MGSEVVMVDDIPFTPENADLKPISLLGYGNLSLSLSLSLDLSLSQNICNLWILSRSLSGITDIEIHFLQIKFTAIGVYVDKEIVGHLSKWKGKKGSVLKEDDDFFQALISGSSLSFSIKFLHDGTSII